MTATTHVADHLLATLKLNARKKSKFLMDTSIFDEEDLLLIVSETQRFAFVTSFGCNCIFYKSFFVSMETELISKWSIHRQVIIHGHNVRDSVSEV